jgi:hypothetical protein
MVRAELLRDRGPDWVEERRVLWRRVKGGAGGMRFWVDDAEEQGGSGLGRLVGVDCCGVLCISDGK